MKHASFGLHALEAGRLAKADALRPIKICNLFRPRVAHGGKVRTSVRFNAAEIDERVQKATSVSCETVQGSRTGTKRR